jgi:hypothetical protein
MQPDASKLSGTTTADPALTPEPPDDPVLVFVVKGDIGDVRHVDPMPPAIQADLSGLKGTADFSHLDIGLDATNHAASHDWFTL